MASYSEQDVRSIARTGQELGTAAMEKGEQIVHRVKDISEERPFTVLATVALTGFAIGALWKLGNRRQISTYDALLARADALRHQAPSLNELSKYIPRSWR